jgi:predicted nucleic acid binding AN1-type Zn finger protein
MILASTHRPANHRNRAGPPADLKHRRTKHFARFGEEFNPKLAAKKPMAGPFSLVGVRPENCANPFGESCGAKELPGNVKPLRTPNG